MICRPVLNCTVESPERHRVLEFREWQWARFIWHVAKGRANEVPKIKPTEEYLKRAGAFARVRAAEAAYRLAAMWREALE